MAYVIVLFVGIATGAACMFLYVMQWQAKLRERERTSDSRAKWAQEAIAASQNKEVELARVSADVERRRAEFESRVISYRELQEENTILKRDLQNIDVNLHKLELDGQARDERQADLVSRSEQLAKRYLAEAVKSVTASVGPNNFAACKTRLVDVIERVRGIGFLVTAEDEEHLLGELKAEFEREVRRDFERQEQARIRAQIREEERLKRELEREIQQRERERLAVQAALDQALAEAKGQFNEEVQRLQARLAEAEEGSKRALSMAQQTKAGHIYVISNVGAFGLGVFKVGMTRRLNPRERVLELNSSP